MILTIGTTPALARSMTFDKLTLDAVNRARQVETHAAGKSINVARVLRTLDTNVLCTGFVGGDAGRTLLRDLDRLSIKHSFVETESDTRVCVTVIDAGNSQATELIQESPRVSDAEYATLLRVVEELIPRAGVIVLAGTLAPGVPTDFYAKCVAISRVLGIPTIVDAKGESLRLAVAQRPTIIKPNRAELAETVGFSLKTDADLKSAINLLAELGVNKLVISDGPNPLLCVDDNSISSITIPHVPVVSPIGSGDSLAAGIAMGLSQNQPFIDAVRLGVACASANAQTPVAGLVDPAEVRRLLPTIVARPLA